MMNKVFFGILLFFIGVFCAYSENQNDSLKQIWQNEFADDSTRFNALKTYYDLNNQTNPDAALVALDYYYELATKRGAIREIYEAAKRKGNIHRLRGNYEIALAAYEEAESLAYQLNDPILLAAIIGNKATVFVYRKDYVTAIHDYSNALKIYTKANDKDGIAHMLTNLGTVYLTIENYDLAQEYYQKSLYLLNQRGFEDRRSAITYMNIGYTFVGKGKYLDAQHSYEKGLAILQTKNDNFFIANCYAELANIHLALHELDQANAYAEKSLKLNVELDVKKGIVESEIILAKIQYEKDKDNATIMAENVLAKLPPESEKEIKRDLFELLYKCYKWQNKLDLSLEMLEKFTIYQDSIQLEKNNFLVAQETLQNEFDLKLYEAELKNEKEKAAIKTNQIRRIYSISIAALLLILGLIFYFVKANKKSRKIRSSLMSEIENLKKNTVNESAIYANKFELDRQKIEHKIQRNLNETDWNVLTILLEDPVIPNAEIAEKAFMSVDGIGSSLRRMYEYFEIKESKYKKISLILEVIKITNQHEIKG